MRFSGTNVLTWLLVAVCLGAAPSAEATRSFDRGEIQARLSAQHTFHHDGSESIDWVQWRNELRFDLKYQLLPPGKEIGFLRTANFNLLYRARFDPVFDLRDSYGRRGYDRDDFRFPEGKYPREVFLDLGLSGALSPLSARIGRQQVVWGEADLFRSIDVVNPLRIDQNGILGEDFSDYREPLWIAKLLWDIGSLGPLSGAGLEVFYSPDTRPFADRFNLIAAETYRIHVDENNVLDGFKRHTLLPFERVRHPWELVRVGNAAIDAPATVQLADGTLSDFLYIEDSDTPRTELSLERSMIGVRLLGSTFGNAYVTFNYLFKRTDAVASTVAFEGIFDPAQPGTGAIREDVLNEAVAAALSPDGDGNGIPDGQEAQIRKCIDGHQPVLILAPQAFGRTDVPFHGSVRSSLTNPQLDTGAFSTGCLRIPRVHPWTHILGFTLTYNDYDWTGFVWRMEQSFSTKEPRLGIVPNHPKRLQAGQGVPNARDFETRNFRQTQVWRSMVGFDWFRSLYPSAGRRWPQPWRSVFVDPWFFNFQFLNEYNAHARNQTALTTSLTDRVQHWNPLLTAGASGQFVGSRWRPTLAAAYEVNQGFPTFLVQSDFSLSNRWTLRVGEIIYAGSTQRQVNSFLNYYANRDTLFVRLTYFLM